MIKKVFRKIYRQLKSLFSGIIWYTLDIFKYRSLFKNQNMSGKFYLFPQIFDKDPKSHTFDKHYVYMDRWAFKEILQTKPAEHVDVGSSIRFLSMATTVTHVKFVDIRPINLDFSNFECITGSVLQMPFSNDSVNSLSCLHVAEHIGLGRYGDPLDPLGTFKACAELKRILAPGGRLYFASPIGRTATYFNAHRIHDPEVFIKYFSGLKLLNFSAINDKGNFIENADYHNFKDASYSCGCFVFTK